MGLATVNLADLQVSGTTVGEHWQKAVTMLVTSLKKNRVCLVNLPAEAASCIIATSTACDRFFDEDSSLKREYSYIGTRDLGYREEQGREVYELPVPMHPGLRTPACLSPWTDQAYAVLDRTARVLLQSLSMSHELELSPYALFPLLDFAPCPSAKMSASSLEIARHFKAGTGLSAVDEAGALLQREEPGILTLLSAWEQGLQVQTAKGVWLDVPLSPNQVAVTVGYTLWHATAGLLEPSAHRMLFRSRRDSMAITYRLAARPSAIIDTPHIMAESGHPIPDRFRAPLAAKELLANFHLSRTPHHNFTYSRASAAGLTTRTPSPVVTAPRHGSDTCLAADQHLAATDTGTPPTVPTPAKPTPPDGARTATPLAALADDPPRAPAVPGPPASTLSSIGPATASNEAGSPLAPRARTRSTTEAESPVSSRTPSSRSTSSGSGPFTRPCTAPAARDAPAAMAGGARARARLTDSETRVRSEDLSQPSSASSASSAATTRRLPSYLQPTVSTALRCASAKGTAPSGASTPTQPAGKQAADGGSSGSGSAAAELTPRKSPWSSSTRSPTVSMLSR